MKKKIWGLKRCPFCGTKPSIYKGEKVPFDDGYRFRIGCVAGICLMCPHTIHYKTLKGAVNAWNRRKNNVSRV